MVLIAVLQFAPLMVHGYSGSQMMIPLLTKAVTVDGKWTVADEWSDAGVIALINCSCSNVTANGYLYAKHDPSNFYFLIDFTSSTIPDANNDAMGVMLDPFHNGGTIPQSDDREFVASLGGDYMSISTGVEDNVWSLYHPLPQGVNVAFSVASSTNQAQPHEIAEFLIPFSTFSGMQNIVGFSAAARHGIGSQYSLALWPPNRSRAGLSTWGELTVSPTPIPEFPYVWLIIAATLLVSLTLTWSRKGFTKASEV